MKFFISIDIYIDIYIKNFNAQSKLINLLNYILSTLIILGTTLVSKLN